MAQRIPVNLSVGNPANPAAPRVTVGQEQRWLAGPTEGRWWLRIFPWLALLAILVLLALLLFVPRGRFVPAAPAPAVTAPAPRIARPSPAPAMPPASAVVAPPVAQPPAPQQVQVSGSLDLVHHEAQQTAPAAPTQPASLEEMEASFWRWAEGRDP